MIRAGKMRMTVVIEQRGTPASMGQPTWVELDTVRAEMEAAGGKLLQAAGIEGSLNNYTFTLRYRDDVTAKMRIRIPQLNNRVFLISYVQTPFGNRELELVCREVMPA
jgi:SPP1 family predicted phage head-tail adaptor